MTPSRKKNRLEKWLYNDGGFFVTICTKNRFWYFGDKDVGADTIRLTTYGKIVEQCLLNISSIYGDVVLADYVIMPNHIHGILFMDQGQKAIDNRPYGMMSKIIKGFKRAATKQLHESGLTDFQWQKSFYDHVIRDPKDMERIQEYIWLNPYERENDEYYR
ncbi:MAG: transposase [Candidatus Absconditabacterales bacterium]